MLDLSVYTSQTQDFYLQPAQPGQPTKFFEFSRHKTFPNRIAFSKDRTQNLSIGDQLCFDLFGQGPVVDVPYALMHTAFEDFASIQPALAWTSDAPRGWATWIA